MEFPDHPGFSIRVDPGIRRPRGVPRKQKLSAERQPLRGDRLMTSEAAIWLNPRYRTQTISELKNYINGR